MNIPSQYIRILTTELRVQLVYGHCFQHLRIYKEVCQHNNPGLICAALGMVCAKLRKVSAKFFNLTKNLI